VARGAFKTVLKVKDGLFVDRLNGDWSGLVPTGTFKHTEHKDQNDQGNNGHDGISVGTVEVQHL